MTMIDTGLGSVRQVESFNTLSSVLLASPLSKTLMKDRHPIPPVLVVDDEVEIREVLQTILEDEGYRVVLAANGREALELIGQERPALVLLDLMMPVMNGWEFLDRLKQKPELQSLPVMILSASRQGQATARQSGVRGFVSKPFELNDLLQKVATCYRQP